MAYYITFNTILYLWDRPFNLKGGGGLWFFVSFRNFFSDNTRVRIFIFFVVNFFPEYNIRLYDKNSESHYFFFSPPKSEYFFQQHWETEYFFRKKTFKLNGRSLTQFDIRNKNQIPYFTYEFFSIITHVQSLEDS